MISPPRRNFLLTSLLLVALTFAAYWPALSAGFIWDDDAYVTHQRHQRSLADLQRIWTDLHVSPQYYPLTHTSFFLEYHLWGLNPVGYHAVNITLHAATACMLALAMLRLGWSRAPAWAAAALFALHPVNVESVAWVTERKNVLCGFFFLATFHTLLSVFRLDQPNLPAPTPSALDLGQSPQPHPPNVGDPPQPHPFRWGMYALACLLFAATLTSKTVGSVLPAVMVLVFWWRGRKIGVREIAALAPLFIFGASMGRVTSWLETTHVGAVGQDWQIPLLDRVLIAGRVVCFYAGKWVWPEPLLFIYPRWKIDPHAAWQYAFPLAAAAAPVMLWLFRHRLGRGPLVAVLAFMGCVLPASGFFNIYPQRFSFVADHFAYLATLVLAVLTAGSCWTLAHRRLPQRVAHLVLALLLLITFPAISALTFTRAIVFQSSASVWHDTYQKDPHGMLTLICLSGEADANGDQARALELLQRAVRSSDGHPMANVSLGFYFEKHGRAAQAIEAYRAAIAGFRGIEPERGVPHQALGRLYMQSGRFAEAIEQLTLALQCRPKDADAAFHLAQLLQQEKQWSRAAALYEHVLSIRPRDVPSRFNRGVSLQQMGQAAQAADAYESVLLIDPAHVGAHINLGAMLAQSGQFPRAVEHFSVVLKISPNDLAAYRNLAVTLGAAGRPADAAEVCDRGATVAEAQNNTAMANDFRQRAARFRGQ